MAKNNDCWGIEIGTSALKAIRLIKSGSDIHVEDYEVIPHKQVLTTPDLDRDEAIQLAIDAMTDKHDLSKSNVIVSVPGNMAFARFAKLPPVEPKQIPDIVKFEAVQQIPFPIEQVEWDYQVFQQEDSPDVEVGIFAITKDRVTQFLNNYRAQGVDVNEITLSPVAVFNAFASEGQAEEEHEEGTILMDIGGLSTDLIIIEGGGIWLRTLPIGGNHFTEALVRQFKLSYRKAEKLKREAKTSKYARQMMSAMRPVFTDLAQEIQKSLGYYQSMNRDAKLSKIIGLGSTVRLPSLTKFLKQQLQLDVVRLTQFKNISVEGKRESDFSDQVVNLATAYGLALQGLGQTSVQCNLLPSTILEARMWKAKQPWFAAAAGCLLATTGIAGFSYYSAQSAWQEESVKVDREYNRTVRPAQASANRFSGIEGNDTRIRIENLRGMLDYRDLWVGIMTDISAAVASLESDPVALSADYEAILALDPSQRRRIYIESIETQYIPVSETQTGTTQANRQALGINANLSLETFWPETRSSSAGGPPQPGAGQAEATADETPAVGPTIRITLTGTTDADDAPRFLTTGIIEWLRQNQDRSDRPYVINVPDNPIINIRSNISTDQEGAGSVRAGTGFGNRPTPAGFGSPQPSPFRPGGGGSSSSRTGDWGSLGELLPDNPIASDSTQQPTRFVIEWDVVLRKPEEARNPSASEEEDADGNTHAGGNAAAQHRLSEEAQS